ncbi:hypothetical protein [Rhodopseudomonas sp. B29]|uniref:hypothetical protein n=1 Tax=Rhodopseudomonas sp. B29 TaxID=95607 RepID=UPI000346EDD5|nr:hypothetical protein [Rhodopseudomonas sp. B29]
MLISLLTTVAGLATGGGGLALAAMYLPSVAFGLKTAIEFLRSPLGQIAGAAALAFVLFASGYVSGDIHGSAEVRAAWRDADALRLAAQRQREAAAKAAARTETDLAITAIERHADAMQTKVSDYAKATDGKACRLATDDDIRRLRDIAR